MAEENAQQHHGAATLSVLGTAGGNSGLSESDLPAQFPQETLASAGIGRPRGTQIELQALAGLTNRRLTEAISIPRADGFGMSSQGASSKPKDSCVWPLPAALPQSTAAMS
jgi:hypothetical protein